MKRTEWQKKEYLKLAEVVNAYKSENVQLIIVDRLLPVIDRYFMRGEEKTHNKAMPDIGDMVVESHEKVQKIGPTHAIKEASIQIF